MYKKLLIIICLFLLVGCSSKNINTLSLNEIIDESLESKVSKPTINSKGFRYYLPSGFSLYKDNGFIHELHSKNKTYYLNVDVISYYYKNDLETTHELDDFEYIEFEDKDKKGYLRITKNNDNFFVELCYNYAIIEVEVKDSDLRYVVSRGMSILRSIEYNDLVIEKYITDGDIDTKETVYKIPEPEKKNTKNILEYIEEDEEE
jgi:hypothetical protein